MDNDNFANVSERLEIETENVESMRSELTSFMERSQDLDEQLTIIHKESHQQEDKPRPITFFFLICSVFYSKFKLCKITPNLMPPIQFGFVKMLKICL